MSFQNEENKLDWMYKSSTSLVNREDYLLGRKIDKSLEKLNTEEKEKELGLSAPKNHVEHECIPPSIRDYNRLQATEQQVDIATKLQEDPLVAIKKREEETRKQFLQNPIQLKKIQVLLETRTKKKKKKKKSKKSSKDDKDDNIASLILEKLQSVKNGDIDIDSIIEQEEAKLDKLLRKKFRKYKEKLADEDLQEVIDLKEATEAKPPVEENNDSDENERKRWTKPKPSYRPNYSERKRQEENKATSSYRQNYTERNNKRRSPTIESKHTKRRKENSDGNRSDDYNRSKASYSQNNSDRNKRKGVTEEEKEAKRREMMDNAAWRDKEREKNVRRYKDQDAKEAKQQDFKQEFAHRELLKSANNSTLESRIKSNVNNIQRSRGAMDKNFSRR